MGIQRLFIANRGEIALRIVRAAHARGIEAVLGVSAADRDSMAAKEADQVITIGPAQASGSYLNAQILVHSALSTGCDAVHPGYGFLSERASFAQLCEENGLIFVGPRADTIRAVGDKIAARALAKKAGVPVVPGSDQVETLEDALRVAEELTYPVITKASAGGGGRGMLVAHGPEDLRAGFDMASYEATEAFGDGTLYLERFVEKARHIEVQVMGDGEGGVLHFGERDCTMQRRYQKMVEEAPASWLPDELRLRIHQAAVDLLSSIFYLNAGTVEFLYDEQRREFYFMEVNARIQVEHPVSEQVSGVDLIQLQLAVASGEGIGLTQSDICQSGHAIEIRVLAEDPSNNFMPSPGRLSRWRPPVGDGVRLDSAMHEDAVVPPYYDSMIAKLIVTGRDRPEAIERLLVAIDAFEVDGISTNLRLARFAINHPDFRTDEIDTNWAERVLMPAFNSKERLL